MDVLRTSQEVLSLLKDAGGRHTLTDLVLCSSDIACVSRQHAHIISLTFVCFNVSLYMSKFN